MIPDETLANLRLDFTEVLPRWGLIEGDGRPRFMAGDDFDLLFPPEDASRTSVFLLTPGEYRAVGHASSPDLLREVLDGLQAAAIDLLGQPFPVTAEGLVLTPRVEPDGSAWWYEGGVRHCRVGALGRDVD
jgi:hypothetical protein